MIYAKFIAKALLAVVVLAATVSTSAPQATAHIIGEDGKEVCETTTAKATDADCLNAEDDHHEEEKSPSLTGPILWSVAGAVLVLGGVYVVKKHASRTSKKESKTTEE